MSDATSDPDAVAGPVPATPPPVPPPVARPLAPPPPRRGATPSLATLAPLLDAAGRPAPAAVRETGVGRAGTGRVIEVEHAGGFAPGTDAGRTVIKWADAGSHHRERALREVAVLARLAPALPLRAPRLFAWGEVADAPWIVLVLEHLEGTPGDAVAGCAERTVRAVAIAAARLHAAFAVEASDPRTPSELARLPRWGIGRAADPRPHRRRAERFVRRAASTEATIALPPVLRDRMRALGEGGPDGTPRLERQLARLAAAPPTLIHADLHLDNLVFTAAATADDPGVAVLDWQSASIGPGIVDLVRFVAESCPDPGVLDRAIGHWRRERLRRGDEAARIDAEIAVADAALDATIAGLVSGFTAATAAGLGPRGRRWFERLFGPEGIVRLVDRATGGD